MNIRYKSQYEIVKRFYSTPFWVFRYLHKALISQYTFFYPIRQSIPKERARHHEWIDHMERTQTGNTGHLSHPRPETSGWHLDRPAGTRVWTRPRTWYGASDCERGWRYSLYEQQGNNGGALRECGFFPGQPLRIDINSYILCRGKKMKNIKHKTG